MHGQAAPPEEPCLPGAIAGCVTRPGYRRDRDRGSAGAELDAGDAALPSSPRAAGPRPPAARGDPHAPPLDAGPVRPDEHRLRSTSGQRAVFPHLQGIVQAESVRETRQGGWLVVEIESSACAGTLTWSRDGGGRPWPLWDCSRGRRIPPREGRGIMPLWQHAQAVSRPEGLPGAGRSGQAPDQGAATGRGRWHRRAERARTGGRGDGQPGRPPMGTRSPGGRGCCTMPQSDGADAGTGRSGADVPAARDRSRRRRCARDRSGGCGSPAAWAVWRLGGRRAEGLHEPKNWWVCPQAAPDRDPRR